MDSIFDILDDLAAPGHTLLRDSFDIKRLGTDISDAVAGAAIHAPLPTVGGFLRNPDQTKFPGLAAGLEAVRPQVLRGIEAFLEWDASLVQNSDYLCLRNDSRFDFLDAEVLNSNGEKVSESRFAEYLQYVRIPHSQAEGYRFSGTGEDYLVGALVRINLNADVLHPRTRADAADAISAFPSDNIYHNNLAQAIEVPHCVDDAIDILNTTQIAEEKPVREPARSGKGVALIEAPRGLLCHTATVSDGGIVEDYGVVVPTAQNQINIENDLRYHFDRNLPKDDASLKLDAESIIRAYDPCMSCATNFLRMDLTRL